MHLVAFHHCPYKSESCIVLDMSCEQFSVILRPRSYDLKDFFSGLKTSNYLVFYEKRQNSEK